MQGILQQPSPAIYAVLQFLRVQSFIANIPVEDTSVCDPLESAGVSAAKLAG